MGHYASLHDKQTPPPVTVHAGPVHASGALSANMVSVIEDYYCPDAEDVTFSAPAIPRKGVPKVAGKKPRTEANVRRLQRAVDQVLLDDDEGLTPNEDMDALEDGPTPTEIQHTIPSVSQKSQQIPQPQFDAEKDDSISMKVTPFTTQEVFVDPFPEDLESLCLGEDVASAEFAIKDENTMENKSTLVEDTMWSVLVNDTRALAADMGGHLSSLGIGGQSSDQDSQTEVSDAVGDSVVVENTIQDLSGGDVSSPTKPVCRLDDLGAKSFQPECPQKDSNLLLSSIHEPYYNSGGGVTGRFYQVQECNNEIYEQIRKSTVYATTGGSKWNSISLPQGSRIVFSPSLLARSSSWFSLWVVVVRF